MQNCREGCVATMERHVADSRPVRNRQDNDFSGKYFRCRSLFFVLNSSPLPEKKMKECVAQTLNDPSNRVLVCTYTHTAADIYVRHLMGLFSHDPRKLLRIFPTQRRVNTVPRDLLKFCLFHASGEGFRDPIWSDVEGAPVNAFLEKKSSCRCIPRNSNFLCIPHHKI